MSGFGRGSPYVPPGYLAGWSALYGNLAPNLWRHAEGVACVPDVGIFPTVLEVSGLKDTGVVYFTS